MGIYAYLGDLRNSQGFIEESKSRLVESEATLPSQRFSRDEDISRVFKKNISLSDLPDTINWDEAILPPPHLQSGQLEQSPVVSRVFNGIQYEEKRHINVYVDEGCSETLSTGDLFDSEELEDIDDSHFMSSYSCIEEKVPKKLDNEKFEDISIQDSVLENPSQEGVVLGFQSSEAAKQQMDHVKKQLENLIECLKKIRKTIEDHEDKIRKSQDQIAGYRRTVVLFQEDHRDVKEKLKNIFSTAIDFKKVKSLFAASTDFQACVKKNCGDLNRSQKEIRNSFKHFTKRLNWVLELIRCLEEGKNFPSHKRMHIRGAFPKIVRSSLGVTKSFECLT